MSALRLLSYVALALMYLFQAPAWAQQGGDGGAVFAFETENLNEGLPDDDTPLRLDTPRAPLEAFLVD